MANTLAQLLGARIAVWDATHGPKQQIDPRAAMGIASHEGLGGGIGDNGTSFGPFQLHYGGAYPSFAPQGAGASQAWATSAPGIDYALGRIANVAGGLKGLPAITAISTRFERPANPQAEIQDAAAHYGLPLPQLAGAGVNAALGQPGSNRPKPGKPAPPGLLASPLPSPGLLASLMGNGAAPVTVQPIDTTPSVSPLQQAYTPIQIPRVQYQPLLAGGR